MGAKSTFGSVKQTASDNANLHVVESFKVGYEFTNNVDTGTSEWEIDEGHPLMEGLEGLVEDDGILPRHALVASLVGVHG